ncbi:MAG: hypothetical protein ACU837_12810 [Gammaproteobacteria bacterium]
MTIKHISVLLLSAGLIACASKSPPPAAANTHYSGSGTLLIRPVTFGKDAYVSDAVQNECELPGKLTHFIRERAAGQYSAIVADSGNAPADAQVLNIEIVNLIGSGGGAWSGAKMVEIKGTLMQNGQTLGDFRARRTSGGGMFAAYKGTCSILGRCVKTLGEDVAEWLKHPAAHSGLGEM